MTDSRYSPVNDRIATWLFKANVIALIGSAATATIGASIAMIPLIELLSIPLFPFPTVTIYLVAITCLYLVIALPLAWIGFDGVWVRRGAFAASVFLALLTGWAVPDHLNQRAGIGSRTEATQRYWRAMSFGSPRPIALVEVGTGFFEPKCDAACLSLLVTGRAPEVVIARSLRQVERGETATGIAFRLAGDWQLCLARLPDYAGIVRSFPADRLSNFLEFGLDVSFAAELPRCLERRRVRFHVGALPTLTYWRSEQPASENTGKVGWQPEYARQQIFQPDGLRTERTFRVGYRYAAPALIFPYGGNAGTGGTFSPRWWTDRVENYSEPGMDPWWSMFAESAAIASEAMKRLDAVVPEQRCRRQPGPCVLEPVGS
ncbi:hypothetical protein FPZ54_01360 [Sphingomonas suaedae]|uniref:Uncharacterized protein n=1 Tax=Sphingomonas suaedae TaxID=2599297 RepID=A0A518RBS5_9SPHN|nr:hypothetical protein [Sphingomonas suaedae]QDX24811.1 hypothetical protein FPZ54_01360 [Sphingomonas suaedae]